MINYSFFSLLFLFLSSSIHTTASSQVLDYQTDIVVNKNFQRTTEEKVRIQINNKQENWLASVSISHSPIQKLNINYAQIVDAKNNIVRKLKKKEIVTKSDISYGSFYEDDLITEFDLYWNEYPYVVEYSYTLEDNQFMYVANWWPLIYTNVASKNSTLTVSIPSDYPINVEQDSCFIYSENISDGVKKLRWNKTNVSPYKKEIYSTPPVENIPTVSVVPVNFTYGVEGKADSWANFGVWETNLNEGNDELPLSEKNTIDKLIEGVEDKREIIRILYHYLQDHTKYIYVGIDVGGFKSYPASYVCENKFGDCKALTTYMHAMLKYCGIDSYYTIINAGDEKQIINKDFPSQQFNHVILSVPLEKDTIWLENTSNVSPFNYLGTFTQDRYALQVNGANSKLVKTPKLTPSEVLVKRDFTFSKSSENIWKAKVDLKLRGDDFQYMRSVIAKLSKERQEAELLKLIDIKGFTISSWNVRDIHRDSSFLDIEVIGFCKDPTRKIGAWEVIQPLNIDIPNFETPDDRDLSVRLSYPIHAIDETSYPIASQENNEIQLPKATDITSPYGRYFIEYFTKEHSIDIKEHFTLFANDIPLDEYPMFYQFIKSVLTEKKKSAILIR